MSSNELKDRILKSSAWQSLRQEQQVARVLTGLEWSVVHSAFYTDAETRKFREVDVIARQSWARAYRGQKIYGQVFAVVECKSATGYHILVSPMHEREDIIAHRMWIGEEDKYYAQVANALKESELRIGTNGRAFGACDAIVSKTRIPHGYMANRVNGHRTTSFRLARWSLSRAQYWR
jgi:hypothetical protein